MAAAIAEAEEMAAAAAKGVLEAAAEAEEMTATEAQGNLEAAA